MFPAIIYDEFVAPETARVITGKGKDEISDNDTCKIITTQYDTTLMVHKAATGEETEYPLEAETRNDKIEIPKMTDYGATDSKSGKVLNYVFSAIIVLLAAFGLVMLGIVLK